MIAARQCGWEIIGLHGTATSFGLTLEAIHLIGIDVTGVCDPCAVLRACGLHGWRCACRSVGLHRRAAGRGILAEVACKAGLTCADG